MSLIAGRSATVSATLKAGGDVLAILPAHTVTGTLLADDGVTAICPPRAALSTAVGADWSKGHVIFDFTAADTALVGPPSVVLQVVVNNGQATRTFKVRLVSSAAPEKEPISALLGPRSIAIARIRRDRLTVASGILGDTTGVSDDYIWSKIMAAEADLSRTLRVPLQPTAFFPETPTTAEITALNGMPWALDPGYDYQPNDFQFNDKWGYIRLRQKPLHSVSRVRFAYPGGPTAHYDLPLDWLRMDKKYGHIQFVPSSTAFAAPLNTFVMQAIGMGRTIPLAIQISYVAGLGDPTGLLGDTATQYPELVDAVQKQAVLKLLEDTFPASSGSISADGLSQSTSIDMDKYYDAVDRIINGGGGKGSGNGGLMTAIHGIRMGVL